MRTALAFLAGIAATLLAVAWLARVATARACERARRRHFAWGG